MTARDIQLALEASQTAADCPDPQRHRIIIEHFGMPAAPTAEGNFVSIGEAVERVLRDLAYRCTKRRTAA